MNNENICSTNSQDLKILVQKGKKNNIIDDEKRLNII